MGLPKIQSRLREAKTSPKVTDVAPKTRDASISTTIIANPAIRDTVSRKILRLIKTDLPTKKREEKVLTKFHHPTPI